MILPLKAKYGLYLMKLCQEADVQSTKLGYFVPNLIPTYNEFKDLHKKGVV